MNNQLIIYILINCLYVCVCYCVFVFFCFVWFGIEFVLLMMDYDCLGVIYNVEFYC